MKTHYKNIYKSDHLGVADLEDLVEKGQRLLFTIREVKQEIGVKVAGVKGNHNVAYFVENIKPLVLNVTNAKVVKQFAGGSSFVEDWKNIKIELFIDPTVKMKGEVVGGVRINPIKPVEKQKPIFEEKDFENAFNSNVSIERIKQSRIVSPEVEAKYIQYAANRN